MGNMTKLVSLAFALLLSFTVFGCRDLPVTCGVPGSNQTCDCEDGRTGGTQTCRDDEWTTCQCEGPIPDVDASVDAALDSTAAGTGGTGGTGAIDAGGTGGTGGTGAVDASMVTDAAVDASDTFPAAYTGPCTDDVDCGPDAVCFSNAGKTKSYCSPTCTTAASCPPAPAGGAPTVDCIPPVLLGATSGCHLACTVLGGCPTGMTCSDPDLFPNSCF